MFAATLQHLIVAAMPERFLQHVARTQLCSCQCTAYLLYSRGKDGKHRELNNQCFSARREPCTMSTAQQACVYVNLHAIQLQTQWHPLEPAVIDSEPDKLLRCQVYACNMTVPKSTHPAEHAHPAGRHVHSIHGSHL